MPFILKITVNAAIAASERACAADAFKFKLKQARKLKYKSYPKIKPSKSLYANTKR